MRKNEKGSSLIFALAVISIITIVIAACMAISYSYYNRSIVANSERQAYLTAKSVLTNIVDNITAKDVHYLSLIPEVGESETYSVDDKFPSSEMGNVESIVFIRQYDTLTSTDSSDKDKLVDKLTISLKVVYGSSSKNLCADVMQYKGENENWQLREYYEEKEAKTINNITKAEELINRINPIYESIEKIFNESNNSEKIKLRKELEKVIIETSGDKFNYTKGDANVIDNTSCLRPYVFYVLQNGEPDTLDINEFNLPDDLKTICKDKKYYIHPMFSTKGGSETHYFIYASTTKEGDVNDWNANFIYIPEKGHWYYNIKYDYKGNISNSLFTNFGGVNGENADAKYQEVLDACTEKNIAQ